MNQRERLDTLVWQRGLAPSRSRAQALILAGEILVEGQGVKRPGLLVPPQATLTLAGAGNRYVSRGGDKLAAALAAFPCIVQQRVAE